MMDPENPDDGLGPKKACHCGMIRHVNADGEPVTAR